MTVREAERDAARLLAASWWFDESQNTPLPIEPVELARGLGIRVVEHPLRGDESGMIVIPPSGEVVITINSSDHPNRQRFTCAHEVGHYMRRMERGVGERRTFIDYRATLAGLGRDTEEIYANQFAAALLMPAHLVEQGYIQQSRSAAELARWFGTSTQALEVRLRNLRLS